MTFLNTLQSNKHIRTAQGHLPYPAPQKVNPNSKKGKVSVRHVQSLVTIADARRTTNNFQTQSSALRHQFGNSVTFDSIFHEPMNRHAKLGYDQKVTDERSHRHSYAQQRSAHRLSLTSLVRSLAQSVPIHNGHRKQWTVRKGPMSNR